MKKFAVIAGALLLASTASSAFAQGYYRTPGYYGAPWRGYAAPWRGNLDYFRQLRACQRHEREHEALGAAHAEEHYEGLESRGDHRDLHDALEDAHDAYHAEHPRADFCDGLTGSYRYDNRGYGYGGGYGPYYGGGLQFGFGFGR